METGNESLIKSISQRNLVRIWHRMLEKRRFPDFAKFEISDRQHDPNQLVFWGVEETGNDRHFKRLYWGKHVAQALGPGWTEIDSNRSNPFARFAFETLSACARDGVPIYSVISSVDADLLPIDCERLLLPFGESDDRVDLIVASLQLISTKGRFDRQTVMSMFAANGFTARSNRILIESAMKTDDG